MPAPTPPTPPTLQGVLFDFDGTLAPNLDLPDMRRQVVALTLEAGVPEQVFADEYIVEIITASTAWLARRSSDAAARYHDRAHQLITDFELAAAAATQPFPGMPEKLSSLRAQGLRLGVVTRNCRAAVLAVFPDLLSYVDALHARDDTDHLKPDPRHLQLCLLAMAVPAQQAAMVGDGALDMHVGRSLDMFCVGVLSGSADHQRLEQAGAHVVIDSCLSLNLGSPS